MEGGGEKKDIGLCTLAIFGTRYTRKTIPSTLATIVGEETKMSIPKITSVFTLGNVLDIKLIQNPDSKLNWVTIDSSNDRIKVKPNVDAIGKDHDLTLYSYDANSPG